MIGGEWKSANEGQKGEKPVKSWKKIGGKDACKSKCEEYAEENNYKDHFRCSYNGDDKKCTITASDDIDWEYYSNWKMIKGDPNPPNLIDDDVESVILGVFNAADEAIETALVNLLEKDLGPMNGGQKFLCARPGSRLGLELLPIGGEARFGLPPPSDRRDLEDYY